MSERDEGRDEITDLRQQLDQALDVWCLYEDKFKRQRDEIEHLREGLDAYRSMLSSAMARIAEAIRGDRVLYSIVDNKNLLYVKTWEAEDKKRREVEEEQCR